MNKAQRAAGEIKSIENMAKLKSPIHMMCPLSKFIFTIVYILVVVSFYKYDLSGLFVLLLFPALGFSLSGISFGTFIRKVAVMLPLVVFVGMFNPFFDRSHYATVGGLTITGGMISFLVLMVKGVYSLMMSFLLIATTPIEELCGAMRRMKIPKVIVTLFLLTYRYIAVLLDEVGIMIDCYSLRAPGQKGIAFRSWGSFLGQLILRSKDKAQMLYESMLLRGFKGEFDYRLSIHKNMNSRYYLFVAGLLVVLCRFINVVVLVGSLFA